jgi:hypothetical protein
MVVASILPDLQKQGQKIEPQRRRDFFVKRRRLTVLSFSPRLRASAVQSFFLNLLYV